MVNDAHSAMRTKLPAVMPKAVACRRDIHEHPALSGHEVRTAKLVAEHRRALGIEVQEKMGMTGVVGVLKVGKPGPVVALRRHGWSVLSCDEQGWQVFQFTLDSDSTTKGAGRAGIRFPDGAIHKCNFVISRP